MSPLTIRNPRVRALARQLADYRGTNMTDAIVAALEAALAAERTKTPLAVRLAAISAALVSKGEPGGRDLAEEERDTMWGH